MTHPEITLEGRPWLCRRHLRAGVVSEPICCRLATRVTNGRERRAWFGLRLEQKPSQLRADIRAAIEDPAHGLQVLASHAFIVERIWCWGHAATDTELRDRSTRSLRVR